MAANIEKSKAKIENKKTTAHKPFYNGIKDSCLKSTTIIL